MKQRLVDERKVSKERKNAERRLRLTTFSTDTQTLKNARYLGKEQAITVARFFRDYVNSEVAKLPQQIREQNGLAVVQTRTSLLERVTQK